MSQKPINLQNVNNNIIGNSATPTQNQSNIIDNGLQLTWYDQVLIQGLNYVGGSIYYYKINSKQTNINIYGESTNKVYYSPLHMKAYYKRYPDNNIDNIAGFYPNIEVEMSVTLPRTLCDQIKLYPEIGDLILDYEKENQIFLVYYTNKIYLALNNLNSPSSEPNILNNIKKSQLSVYTLKCHVTNKDKFNLLPININI